MLILLITKGINRHVAQPCVIAPPFSVAPWYQRLCIKKLLALGRRTALGGITGMSWRLLRSLHPHYLVYI